MENSKFQLKITGSIHDLAELLNRIAGHSAGTIEPLPSEEQMSEMEMRYCPICKGVTATRIEKMDGDVEYICINCEDKRLREEKDEKPPQKRAPRKFKDRTCSLCQKDYTPIGPRGDVCQKCRDLDKAPAEIKENKSKPYETSK